MTNAISLETVQRILKFRDDREWGQFHNPKDLSLSICLEAAELLECFQWTGADTDNPGKRSAMVEELADVLTYCVLLSDRLGLNMDEIVQDKLTKSEAKYPVALARGSRAKYTELKERD